MTLNDTCDMDIWDADGLTSIKESKRLEPEYIMRTPAILAQVFSETSDKLLSQMEQRNKLSNIIVYEGVIHGSREKLQDTLSQDMGRKIIVINK